VVVCCDKKDNLYVRLWVPPPVSEAVVVYLHITLGVIQGCVKYVLDVEADQLVTGPAVYHFLVTVQLL
jgi:hypothetical protein